MKIKQNTEPSIKTNGNGQRIYGMWPNWPIQAVVAMVTVPAAMVTGLVAMEI